MGFAVSRAESARDTASDSHMKQFLLDIGLPLATTLTGVAVLTLALFDPVPEHAPNATSGAGAAESEAARGARQPGAEAARSGGQPDPANLVTPVGAAPLGAAIDSEPTPTATTAERPPMNEVMARAIRILNASRTSNEAPREQVDPNLVPSIKKLGEAIKLAREARDDRDLARAEQMLKEAREQMESACGDPSSPLCQSAESIKDLGY